MRQKTKKLKTVLLFANIIDRPSEEAVKHGLDIDFGDDSIKEYVEERLDDLDFEDAFATAEKWARLYGGALVVMLVDDGRGLEQPLDWNNVRSIEELRVYERPLVQFDYSTMYQYRLADPLNKGRKVGEPEWYYVSSIYGSFAVHRSRCLVFRNGKLPERTMNANHRYWGIPEYDRIKRELRECTTSHGDGVKLLERSVQAIYKMKNLANKLATDTGEDEVLKRLQVIDMARGILNSIAIDNDGEEYRYENLSLAGVKEVIDSTCNMLSAVTKIPQTILFGRSPAGMNSTGESDFENYYNMVENIQKQNMKKNARTVVDLILKQGIVEGALTKEPKYKTKFAALWSLSEAEQAGVDKTKADTDLVKAQTEQLYMDTNVLDATEVRNALAKDGRYDLDEVISDNELELPEDTFDIGVDTPITIGGIDESGTDEDDNIITIEGIDLEDTVDTEDIEDGMIHIQMDGGSGSGNWGHGGTPGKKGGSASGGGLKYRMETEDGEYTSEAKERKKQKQFVEKEAGVKYPASAVIILHNGKILSARRSESGELCGPGGKTEDFDKNIEAVAIRETQEEFGITPHNLIPLGLSKASSDAYLDSMVFFTDEFTGTPEADGEEMLDEQWYSMEELRKEKLFPPFEKSLDMLTNFLKKHLTPRQSTDTITADENLDGAPPGNQNAAGPHDKTYDKAIKGIKTSDGKVVKKIDPHFYKQAKKRKVYPNNIANALKNGKTSPGNTGNRTVYSHNGTYVVFDNDESTVKTVIYKGKSKGR